MKKYKFYNRIAAWFVFFVATVTYILTIEPTTSFWDCGEFIASSYKLEVGHPPGAPFFMIVARFFSLFAFDNTQVAKMVNILSAFASSFTIFFLFLTITHFAKKILVKTEKEISNSDLIAIIGSGIVGSLSYTFTDSFWFSAVEAEVYASSSLFTAAVFWAILKWEDVANEKYSSRWLVLISYLMGLSIGVHLLNLLAIPAIVFIFYFKKYKFTRKGLGLAFIISIFILGGIQYGIIPQLINFASKFELFFVNVLGMPYNTGVLIYILLLFGGLIYGIHFTIKKKKVVLNTILLCFTVILIGYSSFTMIVIRSLANPPMDENNPENVFSLLSYLNREQYGDRPLLFGQYYNAPLMKVEEGRNIYSQQNGKYVITDKKVSYKFHPKMQTIFPRMYSGVSNHPKSYKNWANIKGIKVQVTDRNDETKTLAKPTFSENLKFFFSYQIGHMYFRYFLWNFVGRQNNTQGHGGILKGNWLSGIDFIDEIRLGSQENLPSSMKNNKARNTYYFLPLIFGLIGFIFQYKKAKKDSFVLGLLFFFTGLAIILYTNQTPYQPRERDYAYVGSFYVFAIWIGFSILSIYSFLKNHMPSKNSAILSFTVAFLMVPVLLASENWDDHDRSGRYTARDFAKNYLNSCEKNAILFTFGDNDTFPLWYVQEVEDFRTDVRVVNFSLLSAGWYINQMRRKAYESESIKFSVSESGYLQGKRDHIYILDKISAYTDLKKIVDFVASEDPKTKRIPQLGDERIDFIPTKNFRIPVDAQKVMDNGTVKQSNNKNILSDLDFNLKKNSIGKNEMAILDIIANNDWDRPIYFVISAGNDSYLQLKDFFQLEGWAYRLVPFNTKNKRGEIGINTEIMYDNLMNKFVWGRMNEEDVFIDNQNIRTTRIINIRENFTQLAAALLDENKKEKAVKVLDKCVNLMPHNKFPYDYNILEIISNYYRAGESEKAVEVSEELLNICVEELEYYSSIRENLKYNINHEKNTKLQILQRIFRYAVDNNQDEFSKKLGKKFNEFYDK